MLRHSTSVTRPYLVAALRLRNSFVHPPYEPIFRTAFPPFLASLQRVRSVCSADVLPFMDNAIFRAPPQLCKVYWPMSPSSPLVVTNADGSVTVTYFPPSASAPACQSVIFTQVLRWHLSHLRPLTNATSSCSVPVSALICHLNVRDFRLTRFADICCQESVATSVRRARLSRPSSRQYRWLSCAHCLRQKPFHTRRPSASQLATTTFSAMDVHHSRGRCTSLGPQFQLLHG
jgi:hypothetical protein